jgi:hypothetical protein
MIEFTRCPVIDGKAFQTLEEAQRYGLIQLMVGVDMPSEAHEHLVANLIDNAKDVIAILSVKQVGRPRKEPTQRKPRKAKVAAMPETPPELPIAQ